MTLQPLNGEEIGIFLAQKNGISWQNNVITKEKKPTNRDMEWLDISSIANLTIVNLFSCL